MSSSSTATRLGTALNKPPLSVEILPGDGSAWLNGDPASQEDFIFLENRLGIPQKSLFKAYLEATQSFNRHRGVLEPIASQATDLIQSSATLLLANAAHQTAWNVRKQLVQANLIDGENELGFCAALLTVRDCSKQSILWQHRRWLLRKIYSRSAGLEVHVSEVLRSILADDDEDTLRNLDIPLSTLQNEFNLCTLACNTYERNYFAWVHRYRCLEALLATLVTDASVRSERAIASGQMLRDESSWCDKWVERHVSDYSAMQYRCKLANAALRLARVSSESPELRVIDAFEDAGSLWQHAKALVQSYPDHEALWLYLRGAFQLRLLALGDQSEAYRGETESLARQFTNVEGVEECNADSLGAAWNASRFLAWLGRPMDKISS